MKFKTFDYCLALGMVLIVLEIASGKIYHHILQNKNVTADVVAENYMVDGYWQDIDLGHGRSTELDPMNDVSSNLQVVYSYHGKRYRVNSSHYKTVFVGHQEQIKIRKTDVGKRNAKITLYVNS